MKTKKLILIALLVFGLKPLAVHAQGTLTPPGAPGPTMLTLSQVEPRIPIPGGNSFFYQPARLILPDG